MINVYEFLRYQPELSKQLNCKELMFVYYYCPQVVRKVNVFTHYNILSFVMEGRKLMHRPDETLLLEEGHCYFLRTGAFNQELYLVLSTVQSGHDRCKKKARPIDRKSNHAAYKRPVENCLNGCTMGCQKVSEMDFNHSLNKLSSVYQDVIDLMCCCQKLSLTASPHSSVYFL